MHWFWSQLRKRTWGDWVLFASIIALFVAATILRDHKSNTNPTKHHPDIYAISVDTSVSTASLLNVDEPGSDSDSLAVIVSSVGQPDNRGSVKVDLILCNPSGQEFDFYGFVSHSFSPPLESGTLQPLTYLQGLADGEWHGLETGGWCGWGAAMIVLRPGRAGSFEANFRKGIGDVRVGVLIRKHQSDPMNWPGSEVSKAWSQPIAIPE